MTLRGKSLFLQRLIYFSFFDISLIQLVWAMQVRNYKPIDNTSFSLLSLAHFYTVVEWYHLRHRPFLMGYFAYLILFPT